MPILPSQNQLARGPYLGCAGADWLRAPNLNRVAASGIHFTNCYSDAPVCVAARIGLATGLKPFRLGALDNSAFLPVSTHTTYYQRLRDAGYRVAAVGKLDLAKPDGFNGADGQRPVTYSWGFTDPLECEGKMHAGRALAVWGEPHGPYTAYLQREGLLEAFCEDYVERAKAGCHKANHDSVLPVQAFEDVFIGRKAAEWIREAPDYAPWHMFVSFVGPHDPFDPPTEYAVRYRDAEVPPPVEDTLEGKPAWHRDAVRETTEDEQRTSRRQYCAAIEAIDDSVGEILQVLEERGQLDNTYIIFSSDHGEMLGDHGMWTKCFAYEPSCHVPLLIAGPGIEAGRTCDALLSLIDINATVCDLAGLPPQEAIDARSFRPILEGDVATHRKVVTAALGGWRMLFNGRYKVVANDHDRTELYDLKEDPRELHNLANEQPQRAREMLRQFRSEALAPKWNW